MSDGDAASVERAREAALRLLDRSRKTRRELERRLAEKGFPAPDAAAALDRLERVGVVDDAEYAAAYVRSRLARSVVGVRVLDGQLRARGGSEADRARALAALNDGGAGERERAERALAPLLRRWRGLDPREARARATAALLRRGFDWTVAREVLAALSVPEAGDPDSP